MGGTGTQDDSTHVPVEVRLSVPSSYLRTARAPARRPRQPKGGHLTMLVSDHAEAPAARTLPERSAGVKAAAEAYWHGSDELLFAPREQSITATCTHRFQSSAAGNGRARMRAVLRFLVAVITTASAALARTPLAHAHDRRQVGTYTLIVGFLSECERRASTRALQPMWRWRTRPPEATHRYRMA